MATIEINEKLLREYVYDLIASDDDLQVNDEVINEKIDEILDGLRESPEEIISEIVLDNIYFELLENENDDEIETEEKNKS